MLTSDLVRARQSGGAIVPRFLDGKTRERMLPVARALVAAFASSTGATRREIEQAAAAIDVGARDRPIAFGLKKLCEDRATFDVAVGLDPERVRRELFLAAAAAHRAIAPSQSFDRSPIVAEVARRFDATPDAVDAAMFADLADSHRLVSFETLSPNELLDRYDVGLVQALLLRASELELHIKHAAAPARRRIFRAARFFGLLHTAKRTDHADHFRFDGPMSLFEGGQRYGLKLAVFFPRVLEASSFEVTATILHGPAKTPLVLRVDETAGLRARAAVDDGTRPEVGALVASFSTLGSDWDVAETDRIVPLVGGTVCVPDLVFTNRKTGEEVLLELFGFWSRAAVFQRIELIRRGFVGRILLAVSKSLRVSEELLEEGEAGELVVFKTALSAKDILARLDKTRSARSSSEGQVAR